MKTVMLQAACRDRIGTRPAKKIRAEKKIPAVVYGENLKATPIEVRLEDFQKAIHTKAGENVIIQLKVDGQTPLDQTVVVKEIQNDPVTDAVEHVDFKVISMTENIQVKVPVRVTGESAGVKKGGVLDVVHHEIEVSCLPTDIPEYFQVDISNLDIGHSIHVKDLSLPKGVDLVTELEETVVAMHAPKAEEEPKLEEGKAEPEVIGRAKKEGEEETAGKEMPEKPAAESKESKKEG